jgi:hypothetical protein
MNGYQSKTINYAEQKLEIHWDNIDWSDSSFGSFTIKHEPKNKQI